MRKIVLLVAVLFWIVLFVGCTLLPSERLIDPQDNRIDNANLKWQIEDIETMFLDSFIIRTDVFDEGINWRSNITRTQGINEENLYHFNAILEEIDRVLEGRAYYITYLQERRWYVIRQRHYQFSMTIVLQEHAESLLSRGQNVISSTMPNLPRYQISFSKGDGLTFNNPAWVWNDSDTVLLGLQFAEELEQAFKALYPDDDYHIIINRNAISWLMAFPNAFRPDNEIREARTDTWQEVLSRLEIPRNNASTSGNWVYLVFPYGTNDEKIHEVFTHLQDVGFFEKYRIIRLRTFIPLEGFDIRIVQEKEPSAFLRYTEPRIVFFMNERGELREARQGGVFGPLL